MKKLTIVLYVSSNQRVRNIVNDILRHIKKTERCEYIIENSNAGERDKASPTSPYLLGQREKFTNK